MGHVLDIRRELLNHLCTKLQSMFYQGHHGVTLSIDILLFTGRSIIR